MLYNTCRTIIYLSRIFILIFFNKQRTNVDTENISLGPGGRGYGAWSRGSSGGSGPASGPSTPTEEPRGNR